MSETPTPDSPEPGDDYCWPDGERETVVYVRDDGMVATAVLYPSIAHFATTVQQDGIDPIGVNETVRDLPAAEWFADLKLP